MTADHDSVGQLPVTTPDIFGKKLPKLREKVGWTQAELGQFFGVSKISAHRWEKRGVGETEPRKAALRFVSDCLEASPAPADEVGEALLSVGLTRALTAGVHQSPRVDEGGCDKEVGPEEVVEIRGRLGWTQAELAAFLGVTHSVPAVWEDSDGEGPTSEAVRAALLALRLASNPEREEHPGPNQPVEKLREEGLSAFYRKAAELQVCPESPSEESPLETGAKG
ncbi:transcriptional regulator with XRE-family HTH domain [Salinibacter ruber]|uniref:helix-turn-helix domain-containing protein n=1 Tax=Salinibacter ruber TaxID=146919 RepID=UPI0021682163|nr:transcriptional regulator [Salinibacter ruber]MCS4116025.1 transcriptional regulator with XRE-family HTH domain [Salinibacter ruber]